MFVVVSYDISDNKRRTKIFKAMKNYGVHVQYSVFECDLQPKPYRAMRDRLAKLIAPKEDNIRFYFLDEDAVAKIDCIGDVPLGIAPKWKIVRKLRPGELEIEN